MRVYINASCTGLTLKATETLEMNRKQSPLFPSNDDVASRSSNLMASFHSPISSIPPNPPPLFPTRRRLDPLPVLPKLEPTDFSFSSLPPLTTPTTPFHHLPHDLRSPKRPRTVPTTSTLARQRRARLSDKNRCLQKLIPQDRQMDTATLYEETYKYVKFLEAQVTVLQSMPIVQATPLPPPPPLCHYATSSSTNANNDVLCGSLRKLNRQQLLQVLMSSQVAQTVMYANGWCVYSAEQLAVLLQDREHASVVEQRFI